MLPKSGKPVILAKWDVAKMESGATTSKKTQAKKMPKAHKKSTEPMHPFCQESANCGEMGQTPKMTQAEQYEHCAEGEDKQQESELKKQTTEIQAWSSKAAEQIGVLHEKERYQRN